MKGLSFTMTVILVLAMMTAGCNQQGLKADVELQPDPTIDQSYPGATLILGSEDLVGYIRLGGPRLDPVGQLTRGQVSVQNLTEERYTLEYRFDWRDAQGFNAGDPGVWRRFTLAPRTAQAFNSTGKIPQATGFVFTVRLPDDMFVPATTGTITNQETNIDK